MLVPTLALCHGANLFPMHQGGDNLPRSPAPFYPSRAGMGSETPNPVVPMAIAALSPCCPHLALAASLPARPGTLPMLTQCAGLNFLTMTAGPKDRAGFMEQPVK